MKHSKESILNFIHKITLVLLFLLTFIGFLNPARISKHIQNDISLLKSVFYFHGFSSGFVDAYYNNLNQKEENEHFPDDKKDETSLEDFYSKLADMMNEKSETSDSIQAQSQIDVQNLINADYSTKWTAFEKANPEISKTVKQDWLICLFTFISIIICFVGMYMTCGTGKLKIAGFIVSIAGSGAVIVCVASFYSVYSKILSFASSFDLKTCKPFSIPVYIILAAILLTASILSIIIYQKKYQNECKGSEKSVILQEELSKSAFSVTSFQVTYRVISLVMFIFLFLPAVNPARIMENISRNVSLFTSGFAYGTYTKNIERALLRGWLPQSVVSLSFFSSMMACIGVIACGLASCISVGNNKLKRYAHITLISASSIVILSMFGILKAYSLICTNENVEKLKPVSPSGFVFFVVLSGIILITAIISLIKTPAPQKDEKPHIDAPLQLFLMLLPFLLLVFVFSYLPLWGWRYAFFDYSAGDVLSMEKWVGLKWFKAPFDNPATRSDILRVLKNTLAMSGLGILTSWCPMFFAIFLSEIKNTKVKRVVQTLTTIPNFISWVLVYAIAFCIFGTEGFISSLFVNKGIWDSGKNMLMGDNLIWIKMLLWGMWKSLGWSAIMYIAAISGIDQELYEAATVDGASRIQKMFHITLPELIPTFIVLLILSVSNILSNGMDQYLVFKNSTNKGPIEVLDLYVYQLTFGSGQSSSIPFSTVVSMFKSLVSVILLFITNKISKWVRGSSIF